MRATIAVAAVAILIGVAGHSAGQAGQSQTAPASRFAIWADAVTSHVPGRDDAAVGTLAGWTSRELASVLPDLRNRSSEPGELLDLAKRGAVLHADIAMLRRTEAGYNLPLETSSGVAVADGQSSGAIGRTAHWAFARQLLDQIRSRAGDDEDVRAWYRATAAFLQEWHDFVELEPHLKQARAWFPRDAVLALYEATTHEAYATPMFLAFLAPTGTTIVRPITSVRDAGDHIAQVTRSATDERDRAETLLRDALRLDATLEEAHVRLGRLLSLRGRHADAVATLKRAITPTTPPVLEYLAQLFMGQAQQALGNPAPARSAFERAASLFPGAQSARLALSQLAHEEGNHAVATDALSVLATPAGTPARHDPWASYTTTHVPGTDALVAAVWQRWTR